MEEKERILIGLDGKSWQKKLYSDYMKAERKFLNSLEDLPNWDEKCDCDEPEWAVTIAEGDEDFGEEFICVHYCLKCGGHKSGE
jgi:hypothetical protein